MVYSTSINDSDSDGGWLDSVKACLVSPCAGDRKKSRLRDDARLARADSEKQSRGVFYNQPELTLPPFAQPQPENIGPYHHRERTSERKDNNMGLFNKSPFSVRRRLGLQKDEPPRGRPQISGPTNFVHVYSQSFQYPRSSPELASQRQRKRDSFRGLRLTIHEPQNMLSPLLPHIMEDGSSISPPPAARLRAVSEDDSTALNHSRSYSAMSFHLPRRPVPEQTSFSTNTTNNIQEEDDIPPAIPPRARTRPRAYTSPSVEAIVERIASALIERDRLQGEIENVVERQSIYVSSRPTTAHGSPGQSLLTNAQFPGPLNSCPYLDPEQVSSIPVPAMPPSAPSFAERLSVERPRTAPPKPMTNGPNRAKRSDTSYSTPPRKSSPDINRYEFSLETPLAPPLPLVLRPPLRKKKSFSRVSSWLFPATDAAAGHRHQRGISLDSVTNAPRAVRERDGFYQCMPPAHDVGRRESFDTVSSQSTWETEEEQTAPTTWSPGSTPAARQEKTPPLGRVGTFGRNFGPRPTSVGVAF